MAELGTDSDDQYAAPPSPSGHDSHVGRQSPSKPKAPGPGSASTCSDDELQDQPLNSANDPRVAGAAQLYVAGNETEESCTEYDSESSRASTTTHSSCNSTKKKL